MIRKTIIVILTLAAVGTGMSWAASFYPNKQGFPAPAVGWTWFRDRQGLGSSLEVVRGNATFTHSYWETTPGSPRVLLKLGPFKCEYLNGSGAAWWIVGLPLWLPFSLLTVYPTIAFVRGPLRRWRRRQKGLCLRCGYNLTGNVSGICPECGTKIEKP